MNDLAELTTFAKGYAKAWCSQDPERIAKFFAESGALRANDGPPAVARTAIAQRIHARFPDLDRQCRADRRIERPFDSAEYERQLKHEVTRIFSSMSDREE